MKDPPPGRAGLLVSDDSCAPVDPGAGISVCLIARTPPNHWARAYRVSTWVARPIANATGSVVRPLLAAAAVDLDIQIPDFLAQRIAV
jgi:hypothetical protein